METVAKTTEVVTLNDKLTTGAPLFMLALAILIVLIYFAAKAGSARRAEHEEDANAPGAKPSRPFPSEPTDIP
jgi:hypothetical protein